MLDAPSPAQDPQSQSNEPGPTERPSTRTNRPCTVLVLLASHNGAAWIDDQIDSIISQLNVRVSVLVRDDDSTDTTRDKILEIASANPRVTLLPGDSPTGSAAQNFFTLIGNTPAEYFDYVALADQDDIWNADKLLRAIDTLTTADAAGYSSATLAKWASGKARVVTLNKRQTPVDFLFEGAGQGCTFVLTRTFYKRLRQFITHNPNLLAGVHFHDWAIYALARSWGFKWIFDPRPSMIYRQHEQNDTGARTSIRGALARLARIRNGWYREQLRRISAVCSAAAPDAPHIASWHSTVQPSGHFIRSLKLARFCLLGGRRKTSDNIVLLFACLARWI